MNRPTVYNIQLHLQPSSV